MIGGMLMRDLAWVVALAEREHVTETAAVLRVPQPTLSRALARVEEELGARLFERGPDGVHVTPTGEVVVEAARALTNRYQQLVADLDTLLDPDAGVVRLAFLDSMATSLVPRLLRAFRAEAPRMRVLLRQEPGHEMLRDLEAGAVDLAITSVRPPGPYGWHLLADERLALIVPGGHRLARRRVVRLEELAGEEMVTTPVGFGFRVLTDGLLRDAGVTPTVSFESQELSTIEGLVAAGLGVAIVPETFVGLSGTIGVRIRAAAAHRTVGLTWRTDRALSTPARRFRDFVSGPAGSAAGTLDRPHVADAVHGERP
jgi:LysR family transcriptional regulator, transcription activator of glutamate synthase operon